MPNGRVSNASRPSPIRYAIPPSISCFPSRISLRRLTAGSFSPNRSVSRLTRFGFVFSCIFHVLPFSGCPIFRSAFLYVYHFIPFPAKNESEKGGRIPPECPAFLPFLSNGVGFGHTSSLYWKNFTDSKIILSCDFSLTDFQFRGKCGIIEAESERDGQNGGE